MSKLVSKVDLELDGQTYELRANLNTAMKISDNFGGFINAFQALSTLNLAVICFIVRTGTEGKGPDGRSMKSEDMNEAVWRADIAKITLPIGKYLNLLQAGGKAEDEDEVKSTDTPEGDQGNG